MTKGNSRYFARVVVATLAFAGACRKPSASEHTSEVHGETSASRGADFATSNDVTSAGEAALTATAEQVTGTSEGASSAPHPPLIVERECTRRESEQAQRWGIGATPWSDTGKCSYGANDAWLVEVRELELTDEGTQGCPVVVHVRSDGTSAERFLLHPFNVPTCSGQSCWANGCEPFALEGSIGYAVLALHDWDDDGDTEVAFDAWARLSMARSTSRVLVLHDNGKQLRHLAATLSLDIVGVKDADADQRPDFLLRFSSGVQVAESGQGWVSAEEFNLLAHTLPKGRVSVADEVARSFAAGQCANIARTDVYDEQSLLCAKLRGVSYGVALDAFRKACENATTGGCSIEPALVWDAWRLPFTL